MGLLSKNADKPPSPMRSSRKPPASKSPLMVKVQDDKISELQTLVKSLLDEQKGLKASIIQNNELVLQQ